MSQGKKEGTVLEIYGFPIWLFPVFILTVVLFHVCTEWDPKFAVDEIIKVGENDTRTVTENTWESGNVGYTMYMDAAAMCVMGFGFLYVFSKYYVWGGVGMNFFICGFSFLWVNVAKAIVHAIFSGEFHKVQLNLTEMTTGCYVTAALLVSFGAFYGFTTPAQVVLICIIEPFAMLINEHIVLEYIHTKDAGGSLVVHCFGAYFGIGIAMGLGVRAKDLPEAHRTTTYFSDMGAMIGSIVLWMFWPSFNGATFYNDVTLQGRIVMNTFLAICASCVTAFATSTLGNKGRFEMIEIQNATLAGGVIIGMICSFVIQPWTAVLIGGVGGFVSSMGYSKLHPLLEKYGITDSAAVQMLHGIPGWLGAIFAGLAVLDADNHNYMYSYDTQWDTTGDMTRSRGEQFGFVLLAIVLTLAMSSVTGFVTGVLINLPCCPRVQKKDMLVDHDFWTIHNGLPDPRGKSQNYDNNVVLANMGGQEMMEKAQC